MSNEKCMLVEDISSELGSICDKLNTSNLACEKYNYPVIKYDNFYFNLTDLYITKHLLDTSDFEYRNFSYKLFNVNNLNSDILNRLHKFSDFNIGLKKQIGPIELFYENLDGSKFEFLNLNDAENYENNIEQLIKYINFDEYVCYIENNKSESLTVPVGVDPNLNELELTFIDKVNLYHNQRLFGNNFIFKSHDSTFEFKDSSDKLKIYFFNYWTNVNCETAGCKKEQYRIFQYKKN